MIDLKKPNSDAISLLSSFATLLKKVTIYPPGHPIVSQSFDRLMEKFDRFFERKPSLVVGIGQDKIFLDEQDVQGVSWVDVLSSTLHQHSVSQISFHQGLKREELDSFLEVFRTDPIKARNFGGYGKLVASKGITSIEISEIDYRLNEELLEFQIQTMTDSEVWKKIAQTWRPGRKVLATEDRFFMRRLLNDSPRLATLLNSRIIADSSAEQAEEGAGLFFEMVDSMCPDPKNEVEAFAEYDGKVKRVLNISSPKTRYALFQKAALEKEALEQSNSYAWKLLHQIDEGKMTRALLEGLVPSFAQKENFEKTYLHFVDDGREQKVLEKVESVVQDRFIRRDSHVEAVIRRSSLMAKDHPKLKRLDDSLVASLDHHFSKELPVYEYLEANNHQDWDFGGQFSDLEIENRALANRLDVLELAKDTDQYEFFSQGMEDAIVSLIHAGQYGLAAQAMEVLCNHACDEQIHPAAKKTATTIVASLKEVELVELILEALSKWGKREMDALGLMLGVLSPVSIEPTFIALQKEENRGIRAVMLNVLANQGEDCCNVVGNYVTSEDWHVVRNIVTLFSRLHPEALLELLQGPAAHSEARVRKEVAKALSTSSDPDAVAMLKMLANDADSTVCRQALISLGRFKGSELAARVIIELFNTKGSLGKNLETQKIAFQSLGKTRTKCALDYLGSYLTGAKVWKRKNEELVKEAAQALSGFDDPEAENILQQGACSPRSAVKRACESCLEQSSEMDPT